jgi:Ca2+:H+ antiporter
MGFSMVGIALMSELLVASVEAVTAVLGLTPFFVGIIIVPIIGNVAEHLVSVQAARQNKMDLSLSLPGLQPADRTLCDAGAGLRHCSG